MVKIIGLYILVLLLSWQPSHAEELVDSYVMHNENYIADLLIRCVAHHVQNKTNTIDPGTLLPVTRLDKATISLTFAYPYVFVSFLSSLDEGIWHRQMSLDCTFDKISGDLLDIASVNFLLPELDVLYNLDTPELSKKYNNFRDDDLDNHQNTDVTAEDLIFGIKLDYEAVMQLLRKEQEKSSPVEIKGVGDK